VETLSSAPPRPPRSGRPSISRGYLALFATVVIWSLPSLFQFYLLRYYDVWAQNFYRYSVACLAIAPFVAFHIRRGGPRLDLRAFALCLVPSLPNVVHQITQTVSLFYIGPGVYAIFTRSSVIITTLLALIFFPEERHILRQWQFQVGTLLGLLGAVGVFWFQPGTEHRPRCHSRAVDCFCRYDVLGALRRAR
jgi:drug/metabolite transporter (DMT)-like permease